MLSVGFLNLTKPPFWQVRSGFLLPWPTPGPPQAHLLSGEVGPAEKKREGILGEEMGQQNNIEGRYLGGGVGPAEQHRGKVSWGRGWASRAA